jgi:acetyltransferase-like isoleucine patch superfamily enzyme
MLSRALRAVFTVLYFIELRLRGVENGSRAGLRGRKPRVRNDGKMRFGRDLRVHGRVIRVQFATSASGTLTIGNRVAINEGTSISAQREVTIGDDVIIGDFVSINDSNYHEVAPGAPIRIAPIVIGRNVWLARNVVILSGVTIGQNAVVAAGSIVTADVAANTLVGGNPAKLIRELSIADPDTYVRPR